MNLLSIVTVILIVAAVTPDVSYAKSFGRISSRQKRVSDQRVAELETLLALARMRGKLVTVPVGFGRVDPARIGRKRRSIENDGFEKLQRLLQAAARDSESISREDNDDELPYIRDNMEDRESLEIMDHLV